MQVNGETIQRLEALSKIKLNEDEKKKCLEDLEKIISFMNILDEVDTENEEALSHAFDIKNVMREDEVIESMARADILKNAAENEDGCFKVPKTF